MTVVHDMLPALCHDAYRYVSQRCPRAELQSRLRAFEVTSSPTRSRHALARWLVTTEMGADEGPRASSTAAGRVFDKLSQRLAQLITPVGAEALLMRAVHLSRAEFPFLELVLAAPNAQGLRDRLRETAVTLEPSQAHKGLISVLGTLIGLLVAFIGEDLTFRLLRDVWPEVPMHPHTEPNGQS